MEVRMYTIMDRVAEDSAPPFPAINDGVARRQYLNLVKDVSPFDAEYALYFIGMYNTTNMRFEPLVTPEEVPL